MKEMRDKYKQSVIKHWRNENSRINDNRLLYGRRRDREDKKEETERTER